MKIEKCVVYVASSSNPYSPKLEGGASYAIVVNGKIIKSSTIESAYRTQPRLLLMACWSALLNVPTNADIELRTTSQYVAGVIAELASVNVYAAKGKHKDLKQKIFEGMEPLSSVLSQWIKFDSGDELLGMVQSNANEAMKSYRNKNGIPLYTQHNTPVERLRKK